MNSEVVRSASSALHTLVCGALTNVKEATNSSVCATVFLVVLGANSIDKSVQMFLLTVLAEAAHAHLVKVLQLVNAGAPGAALNAMRRNVRQRQVLLANAGAATALLETKTREADAALIVVSLG